MAPCDFFYIQNPKYRFVEHVFNRSKIENQKVKNKSRTEKNLASNSVFFCHKVDNNDKRIMHNFNLLLKTARYSS